MRPSEKLPLHSIVILHQCHGFTYFISLQSANHQIQSCYVEQSVPFPTGNPLHDDYPATELAIDIIHLEIRNTLRTRGLLYSFNLRANAFAGLVTMK